MKQLLNNPWVVGALSLLALITVYLRLFDTKSSPSLPPPVNQPVAVASASPPQVPPSEIAGTVAAVDPVRSQAPIVGTWVDTVPRDPFHRQQEQTPGRAARPSLDEEARDGDALSDAPEPLLLQAILMKGSNRIAVINSMFVKVGDRVKGFRVSQIKSDGVWLQGAMDKQWLEFTRSPKQEQVS